MSKARMPEDPMTVADRVFAMRDDFKLLARAYFDAEAFENANDCVVMLRALEKFEEAHIVTSAAWPPKPLPADECNSDADHWLQEVPR